MVMKKEKKFDIIYPAIIKEHLRAIDRKYYSLIRETIEQRLSDEPDVETRNRKPLKRMVLEVTWEICFERNNRFRVFYRIDYENRKVIVLAIGEKRGNRLVVGSEEVEL